MKYGRNKRGYYRGRQLRSVPESILRQTGLYSRLIANGYREAIALAECRYRSEKNMSLS